MIALSNALVGTLKEVLPKLFDEYSVDSGFQSRVGGSTFNTDTADSIDQIGGVESQIVLEKVVDAIVTFPAMLVSDKAGRKLRELIRLKMKADPSAVKSLRFANTDLEEDDLGLLPTVHFQSCSGLETSFPVIVDRLLSKYIESSCPRSVFSKALGNRRRDLTSTEESMLSKALCTVYTVLTRCRGNFIWIEEFKAEEHPLILLVKKKLEQYSLGLTFISEEETFDTNGKLVYKIDNDFVDRIFKVRGDIDDYNLAWEDLLRSLLGNMRHELHACVKEYKKCLLSVSSSSSVPSKDITKTAPLSSLVDLRERAKAVCNALRSSAAPAATAFITAIQSLEMVFSVHTGVWVRAVLTV